jgi:hypothetical protein
MWFRPVVCHVTSSRSNILLNTLFSDIPNLRVCSETSSVFQKDKRRNLSTIHHSLYSWTSKERCTLLLSILLKLPYLRSSFTGFLKLHLQFPLSLNNTACRKVYYFKVILNWFHVQKTSLQNNPTITCKKSRKRNPTTQKMISQLWTQHKSVKYTFQLRNVRVI